MTTEPVTLETSFSQQSLWLIDQADPGRPTYNVLAAVRITGELDPAALEESLNLVVRRHEALRTVFDFDGIDPLQRILPELRVPIPVREVTRDEVDAVVQADIERAFDLAQGPLLRMSLLRLSPQEHVCVLVMHHIITDGWSSAILFQELSAGYEALIAGGLPELPELPIQYADFAIWQRETLAGPALDRLVGYWQRQLSGITHLPLPTDLVRPAQETSRGGTHFFTLPAPLMQRLDKIARDRGASPFMLLLAAFHVLLSRYSGATDITVASAVAGRNRPEVANLIGYFVNTLALRTDSSGDPAFSELLERARQTCLDAYAHQDLPYDRVVEAVRGELDGPPTTVMLSFQNIPQDEWKAGGLTFEVFNVATNTAKFDLLLDIAPQGAEGFLGSLEYSLDLFREPTVRRMAQHFTTLLGAIATNPDLPVSRLPMLSEHERDQLVNAWNAEDGGPAEPVHLAVARLAAQTPEAIAVAGDGSGLSYAELNRRADLLAHRLRAAGLADRAVAAVALPSSPELPVVLLAVQKAGAAALLVDPAEPAGRTAAILAQAAPAVLVTDARERGPLAGHGLPEVLVDGLDGSDGLDGQDGEGRADGPAGPPESGAGPDDPAHLCHLSGQGLVPVTRRQLAQLAGAVIAALELGPADRSLPLAPAGSERLLEEVYPYLVAGASLALPERQAGAGLWELVTAGGATTVAVPPSELLGWTEQQRKELPPTLHTVVLTGEPALRWEQVDGLAVRLVRMHGAVEAAGPVTSGPAGPDGPEPDRAAQVPVGRRLPGARVYVLDEWLEPVPVGVPGELYVGGRGVGPGYPGHASATADRFVPDPFAARSGQRLYRTGESARFLADGSLQLTGRPGDGRTVVAGRRVDPAETEAVLAAHRELAAAAVVARDGAAGPTELVAAYVALPGATVDGETLRAHLRERLPEWLVPAVYVPLDRLPVTADGTVDRAAVAALGTGAGATGPVAPRTPIEEELHEIWAELLGRERIGVTDNLFHVGGTSLIAVRMVAEVREVFGLDLSLRAFFGIEPTIEALAEWLFERLSSEEE